MARLALRSILLSCSLLGCTSGDGTSADASRTDANLPGGSGQGIQPLCTATLTVTGTFAPQTAPNTPSTGGGCQPAGGLNGSDGVSGSASATWTLTVATDTNDGCTTVDAATSYVFKVTQQIGSGQGGRSTMTTYPASQGDAQCPETMPGEPPCGEHDNLTIGGDNDQCNGNFDTIIAKGTQWEEVSLKPSTATFNSSFNDNLTGTGTFNLWPGSAFDFFQGSD